MRKAALPIQRLLGGDQLLTLAHDMHYADIAALYAAIGERPRVGAVGRAEARRPARRLRGLGRGHRRGDRPDRRHPARPAAGAPAATSASWSRASATSGSSSPAAARRCPATTSSASSPAAGACRCTAALHQRLGSLREQPERLVEVEWAPSAGSSFVVSIQVEALDRHGLLSDITRVLSEERVSILSANVTTNRDRVATSRFTFEMAEAKHLGTCCGRSAASRAATTSTACTPPPRMTAGRR